MEKTIEGIGKNKANALLPEPPTLPFPAGLRRRRHQMQESGLNIST